MLHESGSCFVQIGDENLHHVRELMAEVFGSDNFASLITFRTKIPLGTKNLAGITDYIVWYFKNKNKAKQYKLYLDRIEENAAYSWIELDDGERRRLSSNDYDDQGKRITSGKIFRPLDLVSAGRTESCVYEFEYEGEKYIPGSNKSWKTTHEGMKKLADQGRIVKTGSSISYVLYLDDYPVSEITNLWNDTLNSFMARIYVVQTLPLVIQRCMLMCSDPGDLIFDPTCGSGTTAFVAEQWGRRWITCDTSRVAVTLAKQRLMTAKFDYYELAYSGEGVKSGFKYKVVPHITLGSIAKDEPAKMEALYDQPDVEKGKVRVTGPFTVEAVPCLRVRPFEGNEPKVEATKEELARIGETGKQSEWRDELKTTGIRATGGKIIRFSRLEPMVATRFLHAEGEVLDADGKNKRAYISFGPDFGPLEQRHIEEAIKEARALKAKPDFVIFAAFHFDPEAAKDIDQIKLPGVIILKAQMSVDLLTKDLRKKRSSSHSYWLIGQPDVEISKVKDGKYKVKVHGFDYYNPISGEIESKGTKNIAMWFLDTDYDERSLYPDQVFFPEGDSKRDWSKLAKSLKSEVNQDLLDKFSGVGSIPFPAGENKKIAVKIIDTRGIESLVIKKLE
ncbi:MAG: DNA methyltransferase [Candidatus Omnitrophota bacterium]